MLMKLIFIGKLKDRAIQSKCDEYIKRLRHYAKLEIVELSEVIFNETLEFDEEAKEVLAGEQVPEVMNAFLEEIEAIEDFEAAAIKAAMKAVQKKTGHKGKNLFMPIRVATTGQTHGPDLPAAIALIGKEKTKARIQSILS